jgi:hypothetical protein
MRCLWGYTWLRVSRCWYLFAAYATALDDKALRNAICLEEITLA